MNVPIPIQSLPEVDSTSLMARRTIATGGLDRAAGPVAILAARQTGGIGRFSRPWSSPVGGLWMTLVWPIDGRAETVTDGLGVRVGVACVEFVRSLVGAPAGDRVRLKWPNDVLLDGRKVCGVLAELVYGPGREPWLLIGVGLNANLRVEKLPDELHCTAGTLQQLTGLRVDIDAAARDLAARLTTAIHGRGLPVQTLRQARTCLAGVGEIGRVSLPGGGKVDALLTGLDDSGAALYRRCDTGEEFTQISTPA